MPTETARIGSPPAISLLLVCLAVLTLLSAVPSLAVRLMLLPGDGVRTALLAQRPVTAADLSTLERSRTRALIWRRMANVLDDMALAELTKAGSEQAGSDAAQQAWKDALLWQRLALARAPADTFGWARLTYMLVQTEGATDQAASALTHSIDTGPYEPSLALTLLSMAIPLQDRLTPDVQASLPFMIRSAWDYDPDRLAKTAKENRFAEIVEKALADDPEKLAVFREKIGENTDQGE